MDHHASSRHRLRILTAQDHAAAEAVHWGPSGFAGQAGYGVYLQRLFAAHTGLGAPAAKMRDDLEEMRAHQDYSALIAQDLAQLGHSAPAPPARQSVTPAESWGISYGLIGSALGASVILRNMPANTHWPTRYLRSAHDFARSGGVARFFKALDIANPNEAAALQGARAVFACIGTAQTPPLQRIRATP